MCLMCGSEGGGGEVVWSERVFHLWCAELGGSFDVRGSHVASGALGTGKRDGT